MARHGQISVQPYQVSGARCDVVAKAFHGDPPLSRGPVLLEEEFRDVFYCGGECCADYRGMPAGLDGDLHGVVPSTLPFPPQPLPVSCSYFFRLNLSGLEVCAVFGVCYDKAIMHGRVSGPDGSV